MPIPVLFGRLKTSPPIWRNTAKIALASLALQVFPTGNPAYALPGRSTDIALTRNDRFLINVNHAANSVTVFRTKGGTLTKVAEIPVGREPSCVAVLKRREAYVTNSASGTVSVIALIGSQKYRVIQEITVGTEPRGCALTPSGTQLYVANHTQGTVSVIDTGAKQVIGTIVLPVQPGKPAPNPMAIAITDDGDRRDTDETVFVTQFFAELRSGGPGEGFDDGKQGVVFAFPVNNTATITPIVLSPLPDSGFTADRTNFCQALNPAAANNTFCPDPTATAPNTVITNDPQAVFPNQLHAALIRGNRLYLPSIGAQPEPPVKFNVNIQSLVHVVDTAALAERTDLHVNLNNQIKTEVQPPNAAGSLVRLFANDIIAIDANAAGSDFLIVSRGGNVVIRAGGGGGSPLNIGAPNNVVRFQTGNIPTGVVMSRDGRRAYVNNDVNCSVSILNLDDNTVIAPRDVESCTLPALGSLEDSVLKGKLVFFTALGVPDNGLVGTPIRTIEPIQFRGKQSDNGWSSCGSCHPAGLADGVTWIFGAGPRQTIPLDAQYSKINPAHDARILNWSAIRSSNTDFNNNSRAVQGGCGFASDNFDPSNTCIAQGGGSPTSVPANPAIFDHGIAQGASEALDLETLWEQTVRPLHQPEGDMNAVNAGRTVFKNNCASCHGGAKWTKSQVLYLNNPTLDKAFAAGGTPRDPGLTFTANQVVAYADAKVDSGTLQFLENINTFNAANPIEIRDNGAAPLGALGFNVPSLLGINSNAPYFHNGAAQTLENVFALHALGGGTIESTLSAGDRSNLLAFLRTIDGKTGLLESEGDIFKDPTRSLP